MNIKKFLIILVVLTITTSVFAATRKLNLNYPSISQVVFPFEKKNKIKFKAHPFNRKIQGKKAENFKEKTKKENKEVPDKVVYFVLFHHLVGLKQHAQKVALTGKTLNYLKMYEKQGALSRTQSVFLFETAEQCMDEIKKIDDEAKILIDISRAKLKEIKSKESKIPPPSPELKELQKQKDEMVLRFRDQFKSFLGANNFAEFNKFARQKITPEIKNISKKEVK